MTQQLTSLIDEIIEARAAMLELEPVIHEGRPDGWTCDRYGECAAYHDACRSITYAAFIIGYTVDEVTRKTVARMDERARGVTPAARRAVA